MPIYSHLKKLLSSNWKKNFPDKKNYYINPNEKTIFQIKTASFTSNYIFVTSDKIHCTKNHISQVLEYQEKPQKGHVKITFLSTFWLKKRPYFPLPKSSKQKLFSYQQILYFHLLFDSKKDLIFHLRKIRNKKILVISKHFFHIKDITSYRLFSFCFVFFVSFWELKYHFSQFLKYHASFLNAKEISSFYQLRVLKKISFYSYKSIISTFLYLKIHKKFKVYVLITISFFLSFIETGFF